MQWFFANNNERQGPVSDAEFQRLIGQGVIRAETLVWRQGMGNWQPYAQVAATLPPPILDQPPLSGIPAVSGAAPAPASAPVYAHTPAPAATAAYPAFHYGGFWIRFVAKIIDGIILMILEGIVGVFVKPAFVQRHSYDWTDPQSVQILVHDMFAQLPISIGISLVVGLIYNLFFLLKFEATPGKLALGLKVVRSDGSRIHAGRIIGRFFAERINLFILYLGYVIAAFDDQKRALHDYICDTRVIYKK